MPDRIATSLPFTELEVADGNFDTQRDPIDRIIIHTMVGTWEGAASRFDTYGTQVSAHYGVRLDGSLIHWMEEFNTAYHAGDLAMNRRSIGIEHEDGGNYNGVRPDVLYAESAKLVNDICTFYNIPIDREHILKHSEIIVTGCPDALDIDRIVSQTLALNQTTPPYNPLSQCTIDRDNNWNAFTAVCTALGITPNPADKKGTTTKCLDTITALKNNGNLISQVKTILYNNSWSWSKVAALKKLLPK